MNIINPSISMKKEPSNDSPLETECLFGESIEVIKKKSGWVYCRLTTDNYLGWIKLKGIGKLQKTTHRVCVNRTFIFLNKNPKSKCLMYLPMGARLAIEKIHLGWAEVHFFYEENIQKGYVPLNHIVNNEHKVDDWVETAEKLEGTPYKWGGRDTVGIDCSALLQLSYQTYGENIPRNTYDQVNLKKPNVREINNLRRGCVIFWEGHVGIMIDKINCIHANAYHMNTVTEPLFDIINRMGKNQEIIKMMDFN